MRESKELDLSEVLELYIDLGSIEKVATQLGCTRQHIDNEIKRQCGYESGGIKKLVFEFYTKILEMNK
jgi:biotin operon repressor